VVSGFEEITDISVTYQNQAQSALEFFPFAPAEQLELSASLWRQNSVSQIDGCSSSKGSAIRQVSFRYRD
jgi:hypothetical protein